MKVTTMTGSRVLVVEDEPKLARLVRSLLQADGYDVVAATTGEDALDMVNVVDPDLILLDLLLPGKVDGYEVCRLIRASSRVPVIMLTAKAQESDKVRGLDLGADDYITKPFSSQELLARVRAVLRRSRLHDEPVPSEVVETGSLSIDLGRRRVSVAGKEVELTPTEYNLLAELARNAGRVMLHEELLSRVWGPEYRDETEYLRAYIRYLRRKLEEDPSHPQYILSRPGIGYYLVAG
jgi:two-component system, OmpR family, KDP operon response regulator KdpE